MSNRFLVFLGAWILFAFAAGAPIHAAPQLDAAFGLNGQVAVELGVENNAHAVAVQPDGKIIVAGSSSSKDSSLNFSLLRFNKDGSLDPTFNGEGSVITSVSNGDDEALALALLSDGRVVAAGYSHNGRDRDFTLVCYLPDGSLDRTFGGNGVVVTSIGNRNDEIAAITVNSEDMITVAGAAEGTAGRVLATARFFADGVLDSSFGEQGVSLVGVGKDSAAEGILERLDGSLVISGSYAEKDHSSLMLVGLNADGAANRRFGDKGVAIPSGSFAATEGYGLAEDADGSLYVAGSAGLAGKRDSALFRFTKAGKIDTSFGDKGSIVTQVSEKDDVLYAVTVGKKGLMASGYTTVAGTRQFLLATFTGGDTLPVAASTTTAGGTPENTKPSPIQEVRVNGATKVQIRRLQLSSSLSGYTTFQHLPFPPGFSLEAPGNPVQASTLQLLADDRSFFPKWILATFRQFGIFLLPSAIAADSGSAPAAYSPVFAQVVTTRFSEGESVSYAATFDTAGNVIVVGTADGPEASSIVVAQYVPETATDSMIDQPGYTNSYITTAKPEDVTKTTTVTGGEISPALGKTVTKRGVVFSIRKDLAYNGKGNTANGSPSISIGRLQEAEALTKAAATFSDATEVTGTKEAALSAVDFVEEGETINGSGYNAFSACLEKLKPATTYYVRAYALTAEGTVFYGNLLSFRTADACFVATASFGTLLHPGVKVLRDFRDTFLVNTSGGRWLVGLYYSLSPPLADYIAGNELLRFAVRLILLPCIGFSWLSLQVGMFLTLLPFIGAVTALGWFSRRAHLRR